MEVNVAFDIQTIPQCCAIHKEKFHLCGLEAMPSYFQSCRVLKCNLFFTMPCCKILLLSALFISLALEICYLFESLIN